MQGDNPGLVDFTPILNGTIDGLPFPGSLLF
jgi:hypothetical protein